MIPKNTTPTMATPSPAPTCWKVLRAPEAEPASSTGTVARAANIDASVNPTTPATNARRRIDIELAPEKIEPITNRYNQYTDALAQANAEFSEDELGIVARYLEDQLNLLNPRPPDQTAPPPPPPPHQRPPIDTPLARWRSLLSHCP
jgi:hypothetical protein